MASVKEEKKTLVGEEIIREILAQMGIGSQALVTAFRHEEDDEDYAVWKIKENDMFCPEKAHEQTLEIYQACLFDFDGGAPRLYKSLKFQSNVYLLTEFLEGHDLRKCDRESLTAVLNALIYLQNQYWERRDLESAGFGFAAVCRDGKNGGIPLVTRIWSGLTSASCRFMPKSPGPCATMTCCPSMCFCSGDRAVLIDWEYALIMPYPTSLARLIAHGEEDENAFFHMTQLDREFAIQYYFEHFIRKKRIEYLEYRRTLDYFLLYEYCEWVAIGVQYGETDSERYQQYFAKAKEYLKKLK